MVPLFAGHRQRPGFFAGAFLRRLAPGVLACGCALLPASTACARLWPDPAAETAAPVVMAALPDAAANEPAAAAQPTPRKRSRRRVPNQETAARERKLADLQKKMDLVLATMRSQNPGASSVVAVPAAGVLNWGGYFLLDARQTLDEPRTYSWRELRLDLTAEIAPTDKTHFFTDFWIRSLGFPGFTALDDLSRQDNSMAFSVNLREAYGDVYNFIAERLDLRIGRQRIAWGRGDKVNPTDNINPYDLEDLTDFGRHLGSDGVKLSYHMGDVTASLIAVPFFTPSVLPRGLSSPALLSMPIALPSGVAVRNQVLNVRTPAPTFTDSAALAAKVEGTFAGMDASLSFLHARDTLPLLTGLIATPVSLVPPVVDVAATLGFARLNVIGADLAGTLGDVGLWAEAALFLPPEAVPFTADLSALGQGLLRGEALATAPYHKILLGLDYNILPEIYMNAQYLHGFIDERGAGNLQNYLFLTVEVKILDTLKVIPLGGALELRDWQDRAEPDYLKNHYGLVAIPELIYTPFDNAEFRLGAHVYRGSPTTVFGSLAQASEAYIKCKLTF